MSERKLWTPVHLDSDFDLQDSEGGLICLQASCASDEMMCEIATAVNYHERLVEALMECCQDLANEVCAKHYAELGGESTEAEYEEDMESVRKARTLLAALEAEKGGEL